MSKRGILARVAIMPVMGVPAILYLIAHVYCAWFEHIDGWVARRLPR